MNGPLLPAPHAAGPGRGSGASMDPGGAARRVRTERDRARGQAWDDEREPFRYAGAGAPVRWLHRVG